MSKRVSASALALPIDGPDLDHVAKPLNFLDGSDLSHPSTLLQPVASNLRSRQGAQNLHASTDFVPAPAASKGTQASDIDLANVVIGGEPENGSPHQPTNHATAFFAVAQSQSSPTKSVALVKAKRTKSVPLDRRAVANAADFLSVASQPEIDIPTSAISTRASQNPVPHAGASETRFMVARVEAPCRAASGSQMPSTSALEAEDSTKSVSPVLAKAHGPKVPKQRNTLFRPKPASILPELPEIYAMRTEGDCMVPEILDGQKIIVSKTEEVKRGDTVCLWLKSQSRPEGYSALVKKVAMLPPPHVTFPYAEHPESEVVALVFVEQINPPRAYQFRCDQILAMHKVIDVQAEDGTSVMKAVEPVRASKRIVEERPTPYGLLEAYKTWLGLELRHLCGEMAEDPAIIASNYPSLVNEPDFKKRADLIERIFSFVGRSGHWHFGRDEKASDRAALVLSTVDRDWREEG